MEFLLKIPFQKEHRVASDSSQSNFSIMPHHERSEHKNPPWTLDNSCSCLIWDSIWHFSRICFSFPQGSQPFAASAVMVSTCFKQRHALSLTWHLFFLQHTRTAEAHVICSSLLLSWCFSFCNVFRRRYLAMSVRNPTSSWISWDQHTSLYKNPSSQVSRAIFSHVHTTNQRTHRMERDTARSKIK